jgi:phosphoserine phosphatase
LLLTTVTSISSNYFNTEVFENNIPKEIFEKINKLTLEGKPFAAFDLDNTLLINDIGEAVFASLVKKKIISDFTWNDYLNLIEQNRETAYKKVIEKMNGLKLKELKKITHELINSQETYVEIDSIKISIPKPNSIMQSIVSLLITMGVEVYVVTASNIVSAEIVCWNFFGIPASNVFGAEVDIDRNGNISYNPTEIPYAEGKVTILKREVKGRPIITGGDGVWDNFLLNYTKPEGIRLWLGQNKKEYLKFKENLYPDLHFYQILND